MNRSSNKVSLRSISIAIALLAISAFSFGCSATSSGGQNDGDGTATFSDEDLALRGAGVDGEARYGDGAIPVAKEGSLFQDVYFEYDSAVVKSEYQDLLQQNAEVLQNDPTLHAEVEGHTDRRGTNEYNLVLGGERSKAVISLLTSFGVNPRQLSTISYGEEIPLDPGDNESAYGKNRRAHFALYRNK